MGKHEGEHAQKRKGVGGQGMGHAVEGAAREGKGMWEMTVGEGKDVQETTARG